MATWPISLPQSPEDEGYSEQMPYPVLEAPVTGPALTRKRYTAAPKVYSATFLMTPAQLAIFEEFYEDDLGLGAASFDWKERGDPANPTRSFRIIGAPVSTQLGPQTWRVALQMIRNP